MSLALAGLRSICRRTARSRGGWGGRSGGGAGGSPAGEGPLAANAAALTLAHPAPDAELLAIGQGVFEAVFTHDAAPAHLLGLPRGRAAFGEEEVGVNAE